MNPNNDPTLPSGTNSSADTYTFVSNCGRFQFTIKKDFLKHNDPHLFSVYELMAKHKMQRYLHNPAGPAIVILETGAKSYWLDGKELKEEEAKRMQHNHEFNDKLDKILEDVGNE